MAWNGTGERGFRRAAEFAENTGPFEALTSELFINGCSKAKAMNKKEEIPWQ
jgi:hypothetical protein